MKTGLLHLISSYPSPCCLFLILPPPRHERYYHLPLLRNSTASISSSSHLFRQINTRYRRWDSNAENFRTQNFDFNPEEEDEDDKDDSGTSQLAGIWEEFIDGVWIFKAFKSFGWMFPAIIVSLLLATGPKAFLMALALPLVQSALSLAFRKLWGKTQKKPRRKRKTRKKSRTGTTRNYGLEEEEESEENRNGRKGYRSWVAGKDVPVDNGDQDSPSFGGWDELDKPAEFRMGSKRRSARTASEPRTPIEKGKLSRGGRRTEMPLLLRLLIAFFPFLGSWTKML